MSALGTSVFRVEDGVWKMIVGIGCSQPTLEFHHVPRSGIFAYQWRTNTNVGSPNLCRSRRYDAVLTD